MEDTAVTSMLRVPQDGGYRRRLDPGWPGRTLDAAINRDRRGEAENLLAIPDALRHPPLLDALEAARTARFTREEWDAYIAAGMAIQNERGALSLARKEGLKEGHTERGAGDVLTVLRVRGIVVPEAARARILAEKDHALLERWLERAVVAASVDEVIGERA